MCYAERVGKHGVREGRPRVVARRRQSVGGQELVVAGGKLYRAGERRTVEAHRAERDVLHVDIVRAGVSERQNAESAGVVNPDAACGVRVTNCRLPAAGSVTPVFSPSSEHAAATAKAANTNRL